MAASDEKKRKRKAAEMEDDADGGSPSSLSKKDKKKRKKEKKRKDAAAAAAASDDDEKAIRKAEKKAAKKAAKRAEESAEGGAATRSGDDGSAAKKAAAFRASKHTAAPAADPENIGKDASCILLVLGLPPAVDEYALQRHFARCAPLQVRLLEDWGTGARRAAASLALASGDAVKHALDAGKEAMAGCGAQLRLCDLSQSYAEEGSAASRSVSSQMWAKVEQLELKAASVPNTLLARQGVSGAREKEVLASVRHLLLTSADEATARAALDEFLAAHKPKSPPQLLLSCLLKHRKATGGDIWLGRVKGLPLPAAETARLRKILEELDWSSMPADGKLRGNMADNSFKLGFSTKALTDGVLANGPYRPFKFKQGMAYWDAASINKRHRELWEASSDLMRAIDPDYPWTSIAFNRNFRGSKHRDEKDASYQYAVAFGEFEGGELRVHGQAGVTDCDTNGRYVRFDGRYEHEVLPYTGAPRYSVIYFMLEPPWAVDPTCTESD